MKLLPILIALSMFTACSSASGNGSPPEPAPGLGPKGKVLVTYIANEGVMIEADGTKVLIDGLHRKYLAEYAFPPDDLREEMESAKGRFEDVDLLLFSHVHRDHFSADSARLHLSNNPGAVLVSSPQIVDAVRRSPGGEEIKSARMIAVPWERKVRSRYDKGVKVTFLGLSHGTGRHASIQNFGHVVEAGGLRFLHLGDADMTEENFDAFDLEKMGIDVAFVPYWYLLSDEGRSLVDRLFAPKHIVAVHIDVREAEKLEKELEARDPRVRVFAETLETARY